MVIAIAAGAAVLSAGAGIYSSSQQAGAARDAADAQAQSADAAARLQFQSDREGRRLQLRMYNQNRQDQAPYRNAGRFGLGQMRTGLKAGGEFQTPFKFEEDPGYKFRLAEGMKALDRSAASRGMLLSGAQAQAVWRYGQDLASQEYGNAWDRFQGDRSNRWNRLASLAGLGQTSVQATGSAGANAAANIATNSANAAYRAGEFGTQAGNARASGYIGAANAWSNGMSNVGDSLMNGFNTYSTLSQLNQPSYSANWAGTNPYQTSIANPYS